MPPPGSRRLGFNHGWSSLRSIFDLESSGRVLFYSALVGVVSGFAAVGFFWTLSTFQEYVLAEQIGFEPPPAGSEPPVANVRLPERWWLVLIGPTLGGLACGVLVYGLAPEAEGHGTDAMVRSFHRLAGSIRGRVPIVKAMASVFTIGTGGSAGREGPIAQIGAGFASLLATRMKLSGWERRQLMLAGAAGGIGAVFQAPLGGALFVVEVLYASTAIEFSALIPCIVSSVVAYSMFAAIYGPGQAFTTPDSIAFEGFHELPIYLVFAVVCAVAGFLYVNIFYGMRNRVFRKIPIPRMLKPAVGGLMLGVTALFFPHVMAGGYGWVQQIIDEQFVPQGGIAAGWLVGLPPTVQLISLLAMLAAAKMVATSFTISSGGSGGVFAPSLFIGAMLGAAYGYSAQAIFGPGAVPPPAAFVLVGMGGFFAGVAKVPLTALIMVSEMSGSYHLLVPLMLVSFLNVAILSPRWTLYEEQVTSLIDSPAHFGDFVVDVLAQIRVEAVYRPDEYLELVPENMPLDDIMRLIAVSQTHYFPVVDEHQRMVGIFSLHDVRSVLRREHPDNLIVAADIATFPVITVTPEDDLHTALRRFTRKNIDELPVVDSSDPRRILGMLRRKEVIGAYDEQLSMLRNDGYSR